MNHATQQRVRVLTLRIALERVAASSYDRVCRPQTREQQNRISSRLLFVLAGIPEQEFLAARQIVQRARHVYKQTSEVMHGHLGLIDLPDAVVDEWEQIVQDLRSLAQRSVPAVQTSHTGSN
ncbi:hypothetical protein Kisp01_69920 [Kineosporia sp. NBRC 101677]|uniref:hypothetical protein n=1 Tax=Kineosporia sp. NBRC 101677 TaxID=3032197 RepID=UPI0024A04D19|nr:hypothetical protein [Kineosporia sp. NBRC 101677]GLY19978.1 hypothetical protein Kisp01_69920 [Kineosporia sp. NBRC 101677]